MSFIELKQVSFTYPLEKQAVLSGIDLKIKQDEITALVGANGSGKTTLTKLMIGVLKPAIGEVLLEDQITQNYTLAEIGKKIGYVFQNPELQLFCNTVAEEVGFGLTNRGYAPNIVKEKVEYYLDYFELSQYKKTSPLHLSLGEKRRLAIASVLVNNADFLILDEPTVGLDEFRKKNLEKQLEKIVLLGKGFMLVSHDRLFIDSLAQRVITIEAGRVINDVRR